MSERAFSFFHARSPAHMCYCCCGCAFYSTHFTDSFDFFHSCVKWTHTEISVQLNHRSNKVNRGKWNEKWKSNAHNEKRSFFLSKLDRSLWTVRPNCATTSSSYKKPAGKKFNLFMAFFFNDWTNMLLLELASRVPIRIKLQLRTVMQTENSDLGAQHSIQLITLYLFGTLRSLLNYRCPLSALFSLRLALSLSLPVS